MVFRHLSFSGFDTKCEEGQPSWLLRGPQGRNKASCQQLAPHEEAILDVNMVPSWMWTCQPLPSFQMTTNLASGFTVTDEQFYATEPLLDS